MGIFSFVKAGKKIYGTIKSVKPATGLTTKRNIQDKTTQAIDKGSKEALKGAEPSAAVKQKMSELKKESSKKLKGVSYEFDRLEKKFAKTKANIEKKKKIKTAAGATAVGSGTVAAGLIGKKIKEKRDKKMGGGMMGRRMGYSQGSKSLVGKQKNIDVAAPFGKITEADFKKLKKK